MKDNKSVLNLWLAQTVFSGQNANLSFRKDTLYSYQTPIARIQGDYVLVGMRYYGSTTQRHVSTAINAAVATGRKVVKVLGVTSSDDENIRWMHQEIDRLEDQASRSKKYNEVYEAQAEEMRWNLETFINVFAKEIA